MGTRNTIKNILSFLLILCGIVCAAMIYFVTRARLNAAANSYNVMLAADIMIFIYAIIFFVCGLVALVRRTPRSVVRVRPFVQVGVFLCIIQLILSATNGILIDHLIILAAAGIVIPQLYFFIIGAIMARK